MDDWDDENFEPAPPTKEQSRGMWDNEDAEDDGVKESWEDEDVAPAPKPVPSEEKTVPKLDSKAAGKKVKESQQKVTEVSQVAAEVLMDPVAEKLRQQRLVEEADFKSTAELFAKKGDTISLDNFIPKSESDFLEYADFISHKLRPYEKSFHYISLLKSVMRLCMTSLKAADAKEIASSITAIANEKLKAEKEANAGKKKHGAKKKQLHVGKPDDDMVVDRYAVVGEDYDFM